MCSVWMMPFAMAALFLVADYPAARAVPANTQPANAGMADTDTLSAQARRGPRGGVAARGPGGNVAARGPYRGGVYRGAAYRGGYRVGGRYYGGVWYGTGRRWWGGRWWPY